MDSRNSSLNFTKRALDALGSLHSSQRTYYHDTAVRGLTLAVSPSGRKTFCLYRKIQGRPERISIGPFPDLTIEQARGVAHDLNSSIAKGINPADGLRTRRQELSLEEFFHEQFRARHVLSHYKSPRNVDSIFNSSLKTLAKQKLGSIRSRDVTKLHIDLGGERGPYSANRAIELLRTMFNRATDWNLFHGPNPVVGVHRFREQARRRFLHADELPRFFKSLDQEPNSDLRDFFALKLLIGARRSNMQGMRWDQIHLERATWTIPANLTKESNEIELPLAGDAVKILKTRRTNATSPWVFPGRGKTGHLVEPKSAWRRILERAGLEDLRMHDLRRTLGSWQAAMGASLPIIGKSLGHMSTEATMVYARLDIDPVRKSVNTAARAILKAGRVLAKKESRGHE